MAKIRVESKCAVYDGMSITFRAPCDSSAVDGINVHNSGITQAFSFRDANGGDLTGLENLFKEGAYVKAVLDTGNGYAYLQNADTNAYVEEINAMKAESFTASDVSVSSWVSNSTYSGFPYRASVAISGVTAEYVPDVTFSLADSISGDYAPVAESYNGGVYLYSKVNTAIVVPSIICTKGVAV